MMIPRRIVYLLAIVLTGCAPRPAERPHVELDTLGGEVWAFSVAVSGRIAGVCEGVTVESPAGSRKAAVIENHFTATIDLREGENAVAAYCMQGGKIAARSQPQRWMVRVPDRPRAWVRISVEGGNIHLDAGRSEPGALPAPIVTHEWYAETGNPEPLIAANAMALDLRTPMALRKLTLRTPSRDGDYQVRLEVTDALGRADVARGMFRVRRGRAEPIDLAREHPGWVDAVVLYGAAPFVYDPQTFAGVRERLDEIAALGATAVWLSPVNAAPADDFGYEVTDHFGLNARFGDAAALRALVERAHRLGLKVLLDVVPNHVSDDHRFFAQATSLGARSPYYQWFARDEDGEILQYFDWTHLKPLNFDHPQVRAYMIAALTAWVREFDVDGFRVDASWAVARRAPEFWSQVREEIKRIKPSFFLLAEASAREPYHVANGFDAAYDWTWNLGEWAWRGVFDEGRADLRKLRAALTNEGQGFPSDSLILRFLNNNDTGERFAVQHGLDVAALAATMVFTLPGLPLIYNGDEMALDFLPYDEGPPLRWNDAHPMVDHYRALSTMRRTQRALQSRELVLLATSESDCALTYERPTVERAAAILVALNYCERPVVIRASDSATLERLTRFSGAQDLLTGTSVPDATRMRLRPRQGLVLKQTAASL